MEASRHWQAALGQLQMEMPRASYDTWVRDAILLTYEDGTYVIGVHNAYARDWLEDRLLATAKRLLAGIAGRTVDVRFVVWQGDLAEEEQSVPLLPPASGHAPAPCKCVLNPRYSFDNFVVGAGNRLAHAAARAVVESTARSYNPLFIYGGVGLGKTHLLHAIGNACLASGKLVLYVSSEEFTNDLINAIRNHTTEGFRDRYRHAVVLLVDDIQFIAGKESTQEEFFHTFNALHAQDRQIVVSSDRSPKALVTLEERLRSRFEWGLTADIQPPDFETRQAILRSKAEKAGRSVDPMLLETIARNVRSNIRELEGALTKVLAISELSGVALTPEMVEGALAHLVSSSKTLDPQAILETVSTYFGVGIDRLLSSERSARVALPRQVAMHLMRSETRASLPQIGQSLGGRDHTTILHGCKKIANLLETDDALRRQVAAIRERLYVGEQVPA